MSKSKKNVTKLLFSVIITTILLLAGSCQNWMSSDDFMSKIESEVHDANATEVNVYVRYANQTMGTTEPSGNTIMKVDVASKISAITNDDYGFVKWAAFTTKDFPTGKQHSSLIFVTEADYNENYKKKELPDTLVHFDNPTSPTTEVKIFTSQNDIFIIPIVAERPGKKGSFPKDTSENNVKNTSITVYFSKAIKEDSLKNTNEDSSEESGKNVNFSITSMSFNSYLAGDTSNIEEEDITDYFTYELDSSGTILTFTLKEGKLLGSNQTITVTLYEDICDRDGFKMKGNSIFTFDTGTQSDNLAPIIEVLLGGRGDTRLGDFVSFHKDDEIKGSATEAAEKAPKNINDEVYTSSLIAQRVSDKLYIYVKAVDIIGAGANAPETANTLKEENVRYIGVRASLYIENKDDKGVPLTKNREELVESIKKNNMLYIPDNIDEKTDTSGLFSELFQDIVPLEDKDKEDSAYNGGEIFSYDVSNLPDGLIKIDVWGMDKNNNSGDDFSKGAAYYKNHDNGYKSIFVVKDTTPPDSAKESSKIKSNSAQAPYYWYNNTTLKTMQLYDLDTNQITDNGHVKLRSLAENLQWNFVVGKSTAVPAEDDDGWHYIHDSDTGVSLKYPLDNAKAPETDGPIDITFYIRDDLGNVSEPVLLDSLLYDNTNPTVTLLDNYGDFINEDGGKELHSSKDKVIPQILKVSFTEPNVNNAGSGIRRIEIHVKKGNKEVEVPLDQEKFAVKWSTDENATPKTAETISMAADDAATTDTLKVFNVNDSKKITTGTLFVYGLTLGEEDGAYTVTVDLYDSAMNKATYTSNNTIISRDTTKPEIQKVKIVDAKARIVYGDPAETKTWWMPKERFTGTDLNKVSLVIKAKEAGSGLEIIKVADNVQFTSETKLKQGNDYLIPETDYHLDYASNTIKMLNNYETKLKSDDPMEFTLENVKFNNINNVEGNKVNFQVIDFVENSGTNEDENNPGNYIVYYDDTTNGTLIYADNKNPEIATLNIEDSEQNPITNPDAKKWNKTNYTDSRKVALVLKLKADAPNLKDGSGVQIIHLSENAEFTAATTIYVDGTLLPATEWELIEDNKAVKFNKVFTDANTIRFENVQIISTVEGEQTVKADVTDFVGLKSTTSTESLKIIYDSTAPVINNDGINWIPDNSLVSFGNTKTQNIEDQTLKVDFTEETAGVNVIRFDVEYEGDAQGTPSYDSPFISPDFKLYYGDTQIEDYALSDGRYLLLDEIKKSGSFIFDNLKIGDSEREGKYNIKITLLDAAENKNAQTENSVYTKEIFMDTTAPVINEVRVLEAKPRVVYGQSEQTWWMPFDKFDTNNNLSKVDFQIKVDEIGTGLKFITLAQDIEFTTDTKLFKDDVELIKDFDYILDVANKKITLRDHRNPKLKGTSENPTTTFTLKNVKLNQINGSNSNEGNKAAVVVNDFVERDGSNKIGSTDEYRVYYDNTTTTGQRIFADSTAPQIASFKVEDSIHNATNNADNIAYNKDDFTDKQTVRLSIKLTPEANANGSGVKTIHLSENAEFTDATTIAVDGTPLTKTTDFGFISNNKAVEFTKVFTAANEIVFTDVKIISTTEGPQIIKADLTDFVGIKTVASTDSNTITLDKTNPKVDEIKWITDQTGVTTGTAKGFIVNTQTLKIDFTENHAGVKAIKFDIHRNRDNAEIFTNPFDSNTGFEFYYNDTLLTKGVDYSIDVNKRYLVLTTPKTSGSFKFYKFKLTDSQDEDIYKIDVTLLDAAENKINTYNTIIIDNTNPEISDSIFIPNLLHAKELTTDGGNPLIQNEQGETETYWLKKDDVGGEINTKADSIPVYIPVDESNSGIKVITFSESATISDAIELFKIDSNGTPAIIDSSKYTVNSQDKTITINDSQNALKADQTFQIYVNKVGFENEDTETKASKNTIKVKVQDVALNDSNVQTTSNKSVYSDSRLPSTPANFKLLDRAWDPSAATPTIKPSENYTNDSIVNMEFDLDDSEKFGSGYHQFIISGATFRDDSVITMTTVDGTPIVCDGQTALARALSDDKKTLTLKSATNNYVIRQAVKVKITNVQLDNAVNGRESTVTLTAFDLVGRKNTAASDSIFFDNSIPEKVKVFTAVYTNTDASYYQPTINVYPHANGEEGTGVILEGTDYPTFYTATTYETGKTTSAGTVATSSYGAVLGIRASDNLSLGGYAGSKTFLYYVSDPDFSKTKTQVLAGDNLETDKTGARAITTTGNSKISAALSFAFTTGKYSAVIVDEAGNVSEIFHFAIVQDTTKPDVTGMQDRVLLQSPEGSNIYRNADPAYTTKSTSFNFAAAGYGLSSPTIRTKKYVTKDPGSSNKYKIIFNLGNTYTTSTNITKIGGGTPSNTTKYNQFTSTAEAVKIEQYAISTWYGAFPTTTTSTYTYQPVPPYATSYPSGETNNASSTSSALATNARDYFGYSNPSYSSYWHAGSDNTSWHSYSHPDGSDGTKVTDSGNGIVSYIDKDDNLIIEIPNTGFIAPISVFLRDGCGNMSYVVLGLEGSGASSWVPSFIVDNKFGDKATTNGIMTTPVIMQNPHLTTPAATTDKTLWNGKYWDWGNQSGNATHTEGIDGVTETFGFMKDRTKNATYYNPRIYIDSDNRIQAYTGNTNKAEWPKLALTLQYNSSSPEDVMFATGGKLPIVGADENATPNSSLDYTCRALLYCTTETIDLTTTDYDTVKNMMVNSHKEGSVVSGDTGFRSEWVGVKQCDTDQITILLDYPQPDYDTLGWNVNDSETHEPIPYYIWYIFEDRVGNYEIGKVVNSTVTGDSLKSKDHTGFDMWLYDGEAPLVTVVDTVDASHPYGKKPNEIGNTQADIDKLISVNNGFVPYLDSVNKRIWVSINQDRGLRANSLKNTPTGWGVTNNVEYDSDGTLVEKRSYLPFANLQVAKEITGIRAFCWTKSATPPAYTASVSGGNTQGDRIDTTYPDGAWFAGNGTDRNTQNGALPATKFDIGFGNYDYKYEGNKYLQTTTYDKRYTGTKINTVLSYNILNTSSDVELYLHVMDWTGNVVSYRMGSTASGLKFRNDTSYPTRNFIDYTDDQRKEKIQTVDGEYYVNTSPNGSAAIINVRIAGKGDKATANPKEPIQIQLNSDYFVDTNGCGFGGMSFEGDLNNFYTIKNNLLNGQPYLELPGELYAKWNASTASNIRVYFFDKVGNYDYWGVNFYFDNEAPEYDTVSVVTLANSSTQIADPEHGLITNTVSGYGIVKDYTPRTASKHEDISFDSNDDSTEVQKVYLNKTDNTRFHINLTSDITDLSDIKINKWDGSKWANVTSWKESSSDFEHNGPIYAMKDYTKLSLNSDGTGTYYQIVATDLSGNASYQYFKLYLDDKGPELVARTGETSTTPTIALSKGSIGKITSEGTDTYYYTADSDNKATIKFAMTDAGMKTKQKFYYSFDNSTWTTINNPDVLLTEINATVASGNLDKIYLKDIFENPTTVDVNFKYTYGSNDTTIDIPALTYWNTKPAKPTFKVYANDATILTTDNFSGNDGWSAWNTSLLEDSTDTIAINGKSLKWAKISFAKSDKIIGYLVTDEEGNLIKEAEYGKAQQYGQNIYVQNIKDTYLSDEYKKAVGSYSFKTDLKDTFTETLPLLKGNGVNTSYAQATRKYYAVDVVGNISDALTLTYSYSNPSHQATDIHLIRNLDEIEASDVKNTITAAVNNGTLKLAQIADSVVGTTTTRYFSGDYLLLSCTLKAKASDTNDDTPAKVELVDIWGGAAAGSAVRGYAQGDNIIFYPSNQKNNDDRYYCYVAFKVDAFDNNDQYGGSQLYLRVYGKPSQSNPKGTESDSFLINPANEINIRWKRDTSAPVIKSVYIDESRLKGYKASGDVTIGYDNKTWTNGMTNYYSRGMYIYLPVADITDGITYTGNDNNDIGLHKNDFITYAGTAQYKTIVTGGSSDVDSGWQNVGTETISWGNTNTLCYKIAMPDVETVHSEITLIIRDGVGNEVSGIKIGKSDEVGSLWWLVDDLLTQTGAQTTITAPTVEWPNPTDLTGYTFDVTPPVGSIIKSITAKIPGSDTNLVSIVSFNDYKSQPTMDDSNGWINVNGLKVTLNKIAQTWSPQDVLFTINGVAENSTVTKPVTSFVPAKKLNDENVIVTEATWVSGTQSYAITVELKDGDDAVDLAKLSGMDFEAKLDGAEKDNLSVSFSNSKITISGSDIPTEKTWADQVITVSISGGNINGTITKTVLTVPKKELTASDVVSISDAAIPEGGSAYQVSINLQEGIPDSAISTVTVTPEGVGVSLSGHTVTLSNIPAATWADQDITLSVNGNVASKKVLTIPAKTLTASDVTLSTATWSETAESYEITVTRNNGAPASALTSVSANNDVTAAFNDDKSKVTLTGMTKGWTQKPVKLTFNGNVTPDTVVLTIPAKALSANDIEVSSATYDATKTSYTLTVEMKNSAPASLLTKITADNNVSAQLSNDKASVTLTSIPAQGWTATEIKLTANSNIDLGVKLTVPALLIKSNNITWGTSPTWNASTNEYSIGITLVKGDASTAPNINLLKNMTYTASINGTINENISARLSTSSGNKIKFSGEILKTKTWDAQLITININGANIDGTISKDIFTIPAKTLTASDIDSISDAAIPDGETAYKVTINLKDGVPNSAITSVGADNSVTTSLNGNIVTLGNIPAATWTAQDITLSVNGNIASKKVLTIAAKEVSASDVGITVTDPSNGTWVDTLDTVKFKITLSSGLTIKDVSVSDETVTLTKNGTGDNIVYTLTGKNSAKIPKTIAVNVKTNYNQSNAVSVRVFPPSTNENRFFGRSISINGTQEVYTFSETPKSVAAMQTRIIELPAVVQKAWETFTEEKEEVAAALAPASQVVEPKKSSKKATKKAAKKVVEAVTETAAALEVTELPVELLEEPKADDQLAMILSKTANTEETELVEPQASVSADTVDVSVTEAESVSEKHSSAAIWVVLLAVLSSVAGLIFLKKRKVSA